MKIFLIPIIVLILDQISKIWVKTNFTPYVPYEIVNHFIRFTFCENPGIAFGISVGPFHLYITILTYIITIGLIYYLFIERDKHIMYVLSIAFILGGALGNIVDRTMMIINPSDYGGVIDFIDIGLFPYSFRWYIFNIADSSVTIGIMLYLIYSYFYEKIDFPSR